VPFNNKYENIGIAKRLREESAVRTQKESAFSIFMNNTKTAMTDGRDTIEDDGIVNFHTFWKGEENAKSIREARGISHYKIDCTVLLLYSSDFVMVT